MVSKARKYGTGWWAKVPVRPPSIPSQEAIGSITIGRGDVGLVLPSILTAEAVGAHSVGRGAVILAPASIVDSDAFGTADILRGAVNLTLPSVASGEAFGTGVVANPANMFADPSFELNNRSYVTVPNTSDRSTEQARTGTRSFKLVVDGQAPAYYGRLHLNFAATGGTAYMELKPGDVVYVELCVKAKVGNAGAGTAFSLFAWQAEDTVGTNQQWFTVANWLYSEIPSNDWIKLTALYRHTDPARKMVYLMLQTHPLYGGTVINDAWYIDDVQVIKTQEVLTATLENEHPDPYSLDVAGWNSGMAGGSANALVSVSTDYAYQGITSVKWEKVAAANQVGSDAYLFLTPSTSSPAYLNNVVTPGDTVELSLMAFSPASTTDRRARIYIRWRDTSGGGKPSIDTEGSIITLAANTWTPLTWRATVPEGYNSLQVFFRPGGLTAAPAGTTFYFDKIFIGFERYGFNAMGYGIGALSIPDDTQLATDPQILRPELWRSDPYSTVEVVEEDGAPALKVTKTANGYPGVQPVRAKDGWPAAGAGSRGGAAGQWIDVAPGERVTLRCKVKPFATNNAAADNRVFIQLTTSDTITSNPTNYPNGGWSTKTSVWQQIEYSLVVPVGYNQVQPTNYMLMSGLNGDGWFVKDFELSIEPVTNHAVSVGPVSIAPAGIDDASVFGTPALSTGGVTLTPAGIPTAEAVPSPVVVPSQEIVPTGIAPTVAFGVPTLTTGPVGLTLTGIDDTSVIPNPVLTVGGVTLSPAAIDDSSIIPSPALSTGGVNVSVPSIDDSSDVPAPSLFLQQTEVNTARTDQPVPSGAKFYRVRMRGSGAGGGGGRKAAFTVCPGGGGSGGGAYLDTGWSPISELGGTYSVTCPGSSSPQTNGVAATFSSGGVNLSAGGGQVGGNGSGTSASAGGAGGTVSAAGTTLAVSENGAAGGNSGYGSTTANQTGDPGSNSNLAGPGGGGGSCHPNSPSDRASGAGGSSNAAAGGTSSSGIAGKPGVSTPTGSGLAGGAGSGGGTDAGKATRGGNGGDSGAGGGGGAGGTNDGSDSSGGTGGPGETIIEFA